MTPDSKLSAITLLILSLGAILVAGLAWRCSHQPPSRPTNLRFESPTPQDPDQP